MDRIIPWDCWGGLIREDYPSGKRGCPPKEIETMLRMYLMQNWFNLSDEGIEDSICNSYAMRNFMRIDLFMEKILDTTTLLKFRHLLEEHGTGGQIFTDVKGRLEKVGLIMHGGSIVDAIIIASSSTKNQEHGRDGEAYQTRKGNRISK